MKRSKNAGLSMVEILIGIAIFVILMIPIVSGISTALRTSTSSKELQYRNDFAENMMEHIKEIPFDEIGNKDYYETNGTDSGTFTCTESTTPVDVGGKKYDASVYKLAGKTKLGTKHETYSYVAEVSNVYYAKKMDENPTYIDPNTLSLGIIENLDYRDVAIIDSAVLNYDSTVTESFRAKKMQLLKEYDEKAYEQMMKNNADLFVTDPARRAMTVRVTYEDNKFVVRCYLDYFETGTTIGTGVFKKDDRHVQYVPYAAAFDEMPNIYLMYNPFFYNGGYQSDDYINLDISDLPEDKAKDVNVFIVETASNFSQSIQDSNAVIQAKLEAYVKLSTDTSDLTPQEIADLKKTYASKLKETSDLINNDSLTGVARDDVNIHLYAGSKSTADKSILKRLHIYTNIGDNLESDGKTEKTNKKSAFEKLISATSKETKLLGLDTMLDIVKNNVDTKAFIDVNLSDVLTIKDATENNRGLYQVKIWLQKGDTVDESQDPILTGTKGGNVS